MSYLVLARKWRPQTFEEVVGQSHVTRTLQNAIKTGRLAHALLFSGPRGVGKTSVARILAKAINCESGPAPDPCNHCGICEEITAGASVDVQEIDGASNRGIDEIRQLRENLRFRPTRCRHKVYIIDEVHMLTKEAFNALLKTLEEPPPHVYFIFATTEPQKIPATIHSRCQHYEFRRLNLRTLVDHLKGIVEADGLGVDEEALFLLAREAEGSVRDSLSLLDQVAAFGARSPSEVCEALGLVGAQALRAFALAVLDGDVEAALRVVEEVYAHGGDVQKFTEDLVGFLRNLLLIRSLGSEKAGPLVDLAEEDVRDLSGLVSRYAPHTLFQTLDVAVEHQEAIKRSSSPRLALEMLAIRLCHLAEVVGLDALLDRVNTLLTEGPTASEAVEGPPTQQATPASPPPSDPVSPRPETVESPRVETAPAPPPDPVPPKPAAAPVNRAFDAETWAAFVEHVRMQGYHPLASLLGCCQEVKDTGAGKVCLLCPPGMENLLSDGEKLDRLRGLAQAYWGRSVQFRVETAASPDGQAGGGNRACHRRQELVESPLVQAAMEVFQARIADVKLFSAKNAEGRSTDKE